LVSVAVARKMASHPLVLRGCVRCAGEVPYYPALIDLNVQMGPKVAP